MRAGSFRAGAFNDGEQVFRVDGALTEDGDGVAWVVGRERPMDDDRDFRPARIRLHGALEGCAVHVRHPHVEEDEGRAATAPEVGERVESVVCRDGLVASETEHLLQCVAGVGVVLDDEDARVRCLSHGASLLYNYNPTVDPRRPREYAGETGVTRHHPRRSGIEPDAASCLQVPRGRSQPDSATRQGEARSSLTCARRGLRRGEPMPSPCRRPLNGRRSSTTAATWLTAHRIEMDALKERGDRAMAYCRRHRDDGSCQRCGGMGWHAVG